MHRIRIGSADPTLDDREQRPSTEPLQRAPPQRPKDDVGNRLKAGGRIVRRAPVAASVLLENSASLHTSPDSAQVFTISLGTAGDNYAILLRHPTLPHTEPEAVRNP